MLHAAGLERGGSGLVFFGRSGIGKTTLAAHSPWPVLSDELVAVLPPLRPNEPSRICGTPFRKPVPGPRPSLEAPGLRALVELAQGPRFVLERLDARLALRRLMSSAAVPAAPPVWSAALSVIGRLVREVPCYRMAWSLDEPPFDGLAEALRL